jgi:1-acyl-sn-glycerol-3-phosphate acyltransferase
MSYWQLLTDDEVAERVRRLDVPFNDYGLDKYGISREHIAALVSALKWVYRHYFRVQCHGAERIPDGGVMLVGNHSGGLPFDAGMVVASLVLDREPPRLAHGMVDKFANYMPVVSQVFNRFGQFTGLPQHATRLLRDGRIVMAFPEGTRGIGKLYTHRYELVRFGTGFMRLALQSGVPVVPFGFVGAEEAYPVVARVESLGKLFGAPFLPVPRHILPVPLPLPCSLHYGDPMYFEGSGAEADEVIFEYVDRVKEQVAELIEEGRDMRRDARADDGHDDNGQG